MNTPILDGIKKEAMNTISKSLLFGGLPGAVAGGLIDKDKRWRGALIGGASGTGLAYGIGKLLSHEKRNPGSGTSTSTPLGTIPGLGEIETPEINIDVAAVIDKAFAAG